MKECEKLPNKFVIQAASKYYNVSLMLDNHYHIWLSGTDYDVARANRNVGLWSAAEILRNLNSGAWVIVDVELGDADEEDISVGSLEGIL